ncbi:hypothetical protein [Luteococcus sp.]|uniref:hypothetical protein n=1 Tax=Luteococcus sp. TaxID=1969402 RepID=UPI0037354975
MILTIASLSIGMLLCGGVLLLAASLRTPQPDLATALTTLSSSTPVGAIPDAEISADSFIEKLGAWVLRSTPLQPSTSQRTLLRLSGVSHAEFYGIRVLYALVLACAPWFFQLCFTMAGMAMSVGLPAILTVALGLLGWMLPAMRLGQQQEAVNDDTLEAFGVLLDLVVLERMANASAIDAITRAAFVSRAPLFVQVQQTLNRAVLENVQPWDGLRALAEDIQLPELNDLVAIAQLQSEGASLVGSLRARTVELRNAYLLRMQNEATRVTQRMSFAKLLPPMSVVLLIIGSVMLNLVLS